MKNKFSKIPITKTRIKFALLELMITVFILTGGLLGQVHAAIPASERAALIALYNSTDGDNWSNNDGWKTTPLHEDGFAIPGTECTWYGISCTGDSVTTLDLRSNQLSGSIPDELGNMANLEYLYLMGNQLTGSIPVELGNLISLQYLYLSANQLTGNIPSELGDLTNLIGLYLYNNQLTGSIPAELGDLYNLQNLWLSNNRLTGSIPAGLGGLANLVSLELNTNQLTGSIPAELGNLNNLVTLLLYENQLIGNIPSELGNMTNLQGLFLMGNQLTGKIPSQVGNLTNLTELYLSNNQLNGSIPIDLGDLTNLVKLYLNNNQLSCNIPVELMSLTSLTSLSLCGNHLYTTNSDLRSFLSSLQSDWESCQTMPFSITGSVINLHNADDTIVSDFEILIGEDFTGTLPDDIDEISIVGPSGPLPYNIGDFTYWPQWQLFEIKPSGSPEIGEYTFVVESGGKCSTAKDTQSVNRTIPNVDHSWFSPDDEVTITARTPTFSWQLINFPDTSVYYRLKIYDQQGYRVFASPRQQDVNSMIVPVGKLVSGQTYTWRVEVSDSSNWLDGQNYSNSEYQTFYVLYGMPWINLLLLDY